MSDNVCMRALAPLFAFHAQGMQLVLTHTDTKGTDQSSRARHPAHATASYDTSVPPPACKFSHSAAFASSKKAMPPRQLRTSSAPSV
jgi:hypothetical protein